MTEGVVRGTSEKRFAYGSAAAFVIYFGGVGLAFFSQLLLARILGPDSFGIYSYVFAWMSVLAYGAALGFQVSLLRFVSVYESKQQWPLLRGVIQYSERRVAVVSLLVILFGTAGIMFRQQTMSQELSNTFLIGFLLVPAWAFLWLRASTVRAFGGVVSALLPERVMRDGLLLAFVVFTAFALNWTLDAQMVMTAMVVSTAIGFAAASVAMYRLRPGEAKSAIPQYDVVAWRQAALPLLIVGATEALFNRTGVLLLGWVGETRNAGIYGLAFNIAFLVVLPRTAVDTLFAPQISRLYAQRKMEELQTLMVRAASWSLSAAAGIALALAVMAEYLLSWFGPEYVVGVGTLWLLLIGQVISASAGSQSQILAMTGHESQLAKIIAVSAVANAAISALMVTWLGITGAAWAMAISLVLYNAAMATFIWRKLGLWPGIYGIFRKR